MRSITDPPPPSAFARFKPGFGQRFLVTVDTEEEFDWEQPLTRDEHGTLHVARMARFQQFCEAEGVTPLYLVDWPIAQSREAAEFLRAPLAAGKAEIGVQLHPWVNPPFDEDVTRHNSFAGNLPPALEQAKFGGLRDAIEANFHTAPLTYRAGRYGIGRDTATMLAEHGIAIDTSVRANFDYSRGEGPDFRRHPLAPYWLDDERTLLELPLTTVFWGMLRRQGPWLYPALSRIPRLSGALTRIGLLERIPLTPEGVTVDEAIRGVDMALDDALPVLVFSFHSPSLAPGFTPYVRDSGDLEALYDWWERMFAYLELRKVRPTSVAEIMRAVER
jgi:hypothetical protein